MALQVCTKRWNIMKGATERCATRCITWWVYPTKTCVLGRARVCPFPSAARGQGRNAQTASADTSLHPWKRLRAGLFVSKPVTVDDTRGESYSVLRSSHLTVQARFWWSVAPLVGTEDSKWRANFTKVLLGEHAFVRTVGRLHVAPQPREEGALTRRSFAAVGAAGVGSPADHWHWLFLYFFQHFLFFLFPLSPLYPPASGVSSLMRCCLSKALSSQGFSWNRCAWFVHWNVSAIRELRKTTFSPRVLIFTSLQQCGGCDMEWSIASKPVPVRVSPRHTSWNFLESAVQRAGRGAFFVDRGSQNVKDFHKIDKS